MSNPFVVGAGLANAGNPGELQGIQHGSGAQAQAQPSNFEGIGERLEEAAREEKYGRNCLQHMVVD